MSTSTDGSSISLEYTDVQSDTYKCEICHGPLPSANEWYVEGTHVTAHVCSDECLLLFCISLIRLTQNKSTFEMQNMCAALIEREEELEQL